MLKHSLAQPTDLVAWRQVLVLMARIPLLTVQQQEVDHLFLVVTGERREVRDAPSSRDVIKMKMCHHLPLSSLLFLTHSSDSRSLVSLSLSLKQPRECMLSRTSGSISSAAASILMATFLGTGCSGSGSFFPALQQNTGS